jgi:enoyl-CoA hydratase/3-hydroxyacyl-CoA dehydrogenase
MAYENLIVEKKEHICIITLNRFAEKLVKRPPLAVGCVLKAISTGEYEGFEQGLKVEEEGSAIVGKSKDRVEGFSAFLEKREPVFTGE